MVIILSFLLILHNFSTLFWLAAIQFCTKHNGCGFPNSLWVFCLSIYFCCMMEHSGGIYKLESLAALVNEILFVIILFCFVLFWRDIHFHTVLTPLSLEERRKCETMRTSIWSAESIHPFPNLRHQHCLRVTVGHSSLDFTHNKVLKGNPKII